MAKKKSHNKAKKRQFKASASAPAAKPLVTAESATTKRTEALVAAPAVAKAGDVSSDFSHVGEDLRLIGILAIGFLVLQVVLWYLFEHTGFGSAVYHLIKL